MKIYLFLLTFFISFNSFADCRSALTNGQDSHAYKIFLDHDLREQSDHFEMLNTVVKMVMKNAGCSESEINLLKIRSKSCQYLFPNIPYSYSCFVSAEEGYYFINQDMLSNINIIFNRWD